jgi:8-oxo-dGTP diphosphatase
MRKQRLFCPYCSYNIEQRDIDDRHRDYCPRCETVFYDNPLPVVSAVVVNSQKEVLLVLRANAPKAGMWALPSGFVELGETIEDAALRELKEETGITGEVLRLLDTRSHFSEFYGDLIWISFEIKWLSGKINAGDDARDAGFFPIFDLPELAFSTNKDAVNRYLNHHPDL